jgi:hypothetical protein
MGRGGGENAYTVLVGKPEGKRSRRWPRRRREHSIKLIMNKKEVWTRFIWLWYGPVMGFWRR